jgi:hypothetical protein
MPGEAHVDVLKPAPKSTPPASGNFAAAAVSLAD